MLNNGPASNVEFEDFEKTLLSKFISKCLRVEIRAQIFFFIVRLFAMI